MRALNCLVIDDEPLARNVLREYIEDTPFLQLVAEAADPIEGNSLLAAHDIDLIFLDVQMPKMTGVDFLAHLNPILPVIITTAHPQYAIRGYDLDVIDYLLKPIRFERFLKATNKARDFLLRQKGRGGPYDFFFVKCNQKIEKILFDDVLFIQGMANYVIIHTAQKRYVTYLTFKGIQAMLPRDLFIRTHKSYVVSLAAVQNIENDEMRIADQRVPIGKTFKPGVMKQINTLLIKR